MNVMNFNKKALLGFVGFLLVTVLVISYVIYNQTSQDTRISANEAPQENTFYTAVYEGNPVLFYRYKGLMIAYQQADAYTGFIIPYEQAFSSKHDHKKYGDFRQLENPKKAFTFEGYARVDTLLLNEDKTYLVMSVLGGINDSTNYIYQLNLKTLENKMVWQHEIRSSENSSLSGIASMQTFIPDEYIVFALIKGDPPPAKPPVNVIVKNLRTGEENVLGAVGDTKIDLATNTVQFKQYGLIQEPCLKDDPVCFATDTYKIVSKPIGQFMSQPLP